MLFTILQDFEVDLYLGQFWQDPRLAFGINRTIILGGIACEKFWLPDTFFVNSIDTRIHRMVFANKKIWINLINGSMMLSARYFQLHHKTKNKHTYKQKNKQEKTTNKKTYNYSELETVTTNKALCSAWTQNFQCSFDAFINRI